MKVKRILSYLLSFVMLSGCFCQITSSANETELVNGVNIINASKTAQWKENGGGKDKLTYDLLISYYSANMHQTAYMGFELPSDFNPEFVQNAKLKLTTTKLGTAITSNVYGADYNGFENGVQYETSANAPAFDDSAITAIVPAAVGETAECDVTEYVKSANGNVAFRIESGKGFTDWYIGSCNNGGIPPQLEIEYDNGEGAHTVPESIEYENGKITFDKPGAYEAGEQITLTVVPDEHYSLDALTMNGETVQIKADGTYTFSMPARNITKNYIQATFTLADYIKTRNIYEDNMLLQRDKPVYIDGVCQNINSATAYLYKNEDSSPVQTKKVTVDGDEWNVTFDAVSDYTATYKIVIDGDNGSTQLNNVLFGDVFLFTGQSNMWKEVSYYKNTDSDYTQANVTEHLTDKIRVMYTRGSGTYGDTDLQYDAKSKDSWRDFSIYANVSPLPVAVFSAATAIYENNDNIPVGVIANAYPGSYISCWFPNTGIDSCNSNRNKSFVERNWYNGRIYPIRNLKLSGVFWYQGESDAASTYAEEHKNSGYPTEQYAYYKQMLKTLIKDWRKLFGDEKLPFYWVQLTRLGSGTTDENNPDIGSEPETTVKKAQTDVYLEAEDKTNLGVIGTLDIYGRYERPETANNANCRDDIHPGQKWLVGERMANYALRDIYGKGVSVSGPMPKSAKVSENTVTVEFDCTGKLNLMPKTQYADTTTDEKITNGEIDPDNLNEFRLVGEEKVWYAADAEIASDNTVTVTSDYVPLPKYVSYAAKNDYPEAPNFTDDTDLPSYVFEMEAAEADNPPINDDKCVKITAEYNTDGSLKDISTEEINVSEIESIENTPTYKVFYWESLNSMKPIALTAEPTAKPTDKPTPPPTDEPDADYVFKFGTDKITADTVYSEQSDGMTYGFVGTEDSIVESGRFDGFTYEQGDAFSILKNGNEFVEADYSAYDEETTNNMGEGEIPVRFAFDAEKGGYYTVTATVVNTSKTESTEVSLF